MRNDKERLLDILEAIIKVEKYTIRGKDIFLQDELIQTWIVHNLQIIGEASRAMSKNLTDKYTDIEWLDMSDFRNVIVHEYFEINLTIVWDVVEHYLPTLKNKIQEILQKMER
jgi:uncharacterized protein with HEPN domain